MSLMNRLARGVPKSVRALLFAVPLLFAGLLLAPAAMAGTLQIRDDAHTLSADDVSRLRSALAGAPFDGRLVVTSSYTDPEELSRYVGSLVTEPNMVVVGVDPQHRHVRVHFGTGSHVPHSARPAVERAGTDAFRRGDWEGGAAAIFREAAQSVTNEGGSAAQGPQDEAGRSRSLVGPGVLLLVLGGIVGLGLLVAFAMRRRNGANYPGPGGPPYGGGYGSPPYGSPPYGPGGYGYGPPQQGGMGPLGGGLIGAGLGGLAGYELGKMEGEREERAQERGGAFGGGQNDRDDDRGGGNFDDGGGGDDWGDSGGDGGGGFDGGDGGGGGGDF